MGAEDTGFVSELGAMLPSDQVVTRPDALDGLRRDQTHVVDAGMPLAAAFPTSAAEVSRVLALASKHHVPVVPRGAGSGLAGGANATDGCLVLSTLRMDRIVEINTDDLVAVVQPGVLNAALAAEVAKNGLLYAPDPSSFEISSIGGNLATNAGGLRCVKYGVTREATLGIEVVLADGTILRTGRRTVKGVAGYDLVGLFVGSEGTLGVITEATLRLRPAPPPAGTLLASFASLADAAEAVAAMSGISASVMELMDQTTIRAVEDWQHLGLDTDARAVLIVRSDAADFGSADLDAAELACRTSHATDVLRSTDAVESEGLMGARRAAFPALERLGITLLEDVAVPRGRIVELVAAVERIAAEHEIQIGTFGHVGDGNLHPTLIMPRGDDAARDRALEAADAIVAVTLTLGGTITGEHGVGLLKRDQLARELGPEGIRVSWAIKNALDPLAIMNPGKVLPD
ncbi:MAG TPA: FAD-linked oxidase C-terminal domain-containing protein [Candidatus Binatia bacterium]|nr:FAD-linked oxidase C-terminal domain-containing protein [Candidatus Binatia bacterium]